MNSGKKLISNTFYLTLKWFSLSVTSILFWMIVGKFLGPREYGITTTSLNLIAILGGLTQLGFQTALIKLVSEDKRNIKKYFPFVIKTVLFFNFIITLFLIIFYNQISSILKLDLLILIIISPFGIFISSLGLVFTSVIGGLQNMKKIFITDLIAQISKVLLCFVLLFLNFSYIGAIIGALAYFLLLLILRFNPNYVVKEQKIFNKKDLFKYSFPAFIIYLSWLLFNNTGYITLAALKDLEITGKFSVAMLMVTPIPIIVQTISRSLFPIISKLSKNKDSRKSITYFLLSFRYSFLFVLPLVILLISFSRIGVLLISSEEFLEATTFLPFLTIGAMLLGLGSLFSDSLYAIGYPKISRNTVFSLSLLFLVLSLVFTFKYSALGLSFAYFLGALFFFCSSFILLRKYMHFKFDFKMIFKIIISAIFLFLFLYLIRPYVHNFFIAVLLVILSTPIYFISLYFLNFYDRNDLILLKRMSEKTPNPIKKIIKLLHKIIEKKITKK